MRALILMGIDGGDLNPRSFRRMAFVLTSLLMLATCSVARAAAFAEHATVSGELKQWHTVTITVDGPFASESDDSPNPFTDIFFAAEFRHADQNRSIRVPGYFAADGNAAESSADSGNRWRVHFTPPLTGHWTYSLYGPVTQDCLDWPADLSPFLSHQGELEIRDSDEHDRGFRSEGRLIYDGRRYLHYAESGRPFLKVGADAPETLLAYTDFDGTKASNPRKAPLKTWMPHLQDWKNGDPVWKSEKGKGLIGAINYLSSKGCNAFSFLTYNAGGDGDNVWPFVSRDDKLHYDCSKLDQWGIVFEHAANKGMYLHFKLQETENDDNRHGKKQNGSVPESLDGGATGRERKLYLKELVARFGHLPALNWNLGEENTQSTAQQQDMINDIVRRDAWHNPIVVHTFPDQQERVYRPLIGDASKLTGVSLQNSHIRDTHSQTVKWVQESSRSGRPWVVAFDESGSAAHGQCPDLGYRGFDGKDRSGTYVYTEHDIRKQTLWGTLMGGGAGVEYYFGYQFAENDIVCEDWRSRERSWDYCRIAKDFFARQNIPIDDMQPADELVGNVGHDNSKYCLAATGMNYLVYLPNDGTTNLDLTGCQGSYSVEWFNPEFGGELISGSVVEIAGGAIVGIGRPVVSASEERQRIRQLQSKDLATDSPSDWLAVIRRKSDDR
ncbi:MAG: DUF5060 domain-containing protein [Planctomycetaceae bacterium]|nr:DUF5060 domain-containing protein [Planctomycetaceae bacterium]